MKKALFITTLVMALIIMSCVAFAAPVVNDVTYINGSTEVYTVGEGNIKASFDISVDADQKAAIITAAYAGDVLESVRYESVSLVTTQKKYAGSAVSATKDTTRVSANIWAGGLVPISKSDELTKVSREITVSDVTLASADGAFTYPGYADNDRCKIYVEQITDWYSSAIQTLDPTAYSATDTCKKYIGWNMRPAADYPALSNTLNYKFNGAQATSTVAVSTDAPQKITFKAPNGREKVYDVILEKHVAFDVFDFDANVNTFTSGANAYNHYGAAAANFLQHDNSLSGVRWGGSGRYRSGAGFRLVGWAKSPLDDNGGETDTNPERYIKMSREVGVHGKSETDGVIKIDLNKPELWGNIQVTDTAGPSMLAGTDKLDFSFDFCYEEGTVGQIIAPAISWGAGEHDDIMKLVLGNTDSNYFDIAQIRYMSTVHPESGYTGYGKNLCFIEPGQWYNIRMIVDRDNTEGANCTVVVDGKVVYATQYPSSADALTKSPSMYLFKGMISSSATGVYYIDNFQRTYSQTMPEA